MKIHQLVQGTPEWHAHRRTHFNASDAPAMMGCSPYKTRAELLREMHTGIEPEVDEATRHRFAAGHRFEALARPLAEDEIGEELYPVVGELDRLSASLDGITLDEQTIFEHKTANGELRAACASGDGRQLPLAYRVQMEQQLLVSGAARCLFVISRWNNSDELTEHASVWYYPDMDLRAEIQAGWVQFARDLEAYELPKAAEPAPVGKAPETLPALRIELTGVVTASNLEAFKTTALAAIGSVNRDLKTDQDFADADKAIKWCDEIETRLEAAKQHALSQTSSIEALFRTMDEIGAEARTVRLDLQKLTKARKDTLKAEIVSEARAAYLQHEQTLQQETGGPWIQLAQPDFGAAIKGLRSFDSMRDAVGTLLAASKIKADESARKIRESLRILAEQSVGYEALFMDRLALIGKAPDDLQAVISSRIAAHKVAEQQRLDAERERIRAEEEARQTAQRQRDERLAAERKARIDARMEQLKDALTAAAADTSQQIEIARQRILATEPSEDLYGERMGEAVTLRSQVLIALGEQNAAAVQREAVAAAQKVAAAAPSPAPVVASLPPAAPRQQQADEPATLNLGAICARVGPGFSITSQFIADTLGIQPAKVDRASKLYRESDFLHICSALQEHLSTVTEAATA